MKCRDCRWYQTDHDDEWCETGDGTLNRDDCHDAVRRVSAVREAYQRIDQRNRQAERQMRTIGYTR